MVAFDSARDAAECAVAMQQAARRPAAGERLHIRVGLHVGEAFKDEADYFGTAVVIARRLCDRCDAGQIIASDLVVRLLDGRTELSFDDLGALALKGIESPVPAHELRYEHDPMVLAVTPFVGRDDVIAALSQKLAEARRGKGALVMLVGEPGIGKTRAATEFCESAKQSGATVLWGRCYDGEWAAPFSPFMEAVREYAQSSPLDALREVLGADAGVLARIVPALYELLPDIAEPPAIPAEGERYRLLEAAAGFFARLAATRPLVLMLDDLHWGDRGTIAMLRQVARMAPQHRLLIVGTYRDVELDRTHPLADVLQTLRRETNYERIVLKGLGPSDVTELLSLVAEQDVSEAFAQAIGDETGGNPFFIREVMLHLVEEGRIVQENGRWTATATLSEMRIPEGVREVIGRRLSRVSERCVRMLTVASALTAGFSWDVMAALVDIGDAALADAVAEALNAQLIVERERNSYEFTHALIRHTLYEELSTPHRVLLHRQIGEALERLYAADMEPHVAELAHHFYEASVGGDSATAIRFLTRAGEGSVRRLAYEDAVVHFERAAAMETDDRNRCELLLSLASASGRAGMAARANATFEIAGDVALRLASPEFLVRAALGAESLVADAGVNVRIIEAALAALPPGDSVARARCLARLAPSSGGDERAGELSRQAVEMARRLGDKRALAHGLNSTYRYLVDSSPLNVKSRLDVATEVLQIANEIGDKELALASGHCDRLQDLIHLGDIDAADSDIEAHARLSNELRLGMQQAHTLGLYSMRSLIKGRFAESEMYAHEWLELARRIEPRWAEGIHLLMLLALRREQGRIQEWLSDTGGEARHDLTGAARIILDSERDDADACRRWVEALLPERMEGNPHAIEETTLAWLAEVCAWLGDTRRADILYDRLLPYADRVITSEGAYFVLGSGSRFLGLLAGTLGRPDDAERHFEDALAMNTRMGARPWVARTQLDCARMLRKRDAAGDRERAHTLLNAALATANDLGMAKVVADCQTVLARA